MNPLHELAVLAAQAERSRRASQYTIARRGVSLPVLEPAGRPSVPWGLYAGAAALGLVIGGGAIAILAVVVHLGVLL